MNTHPVALVIDDEPANLQILATLMDELGMDVSVAESGPRALEVVAYRVPDIILVDIMMPEMDGYETVRALTARYDLSNVPVLYVTALADIEHKTRAFEHGGHDYITKPFDKREVQARVRTHLELAQYRATLERRVQEQVLKLDQINFALVSALESANSFKDDLTGLHIRRVGAFARILAELIGLPHERSRELERYAPLHDVGKIGVPDHILKKAGPLDRDERAIMEQHTVAGYRILKQPGIPAVALNIVRHHHERWDGTGYPDRLAGPDIPIEARIVSVADIYDALRSWRPYKEPFDHETAIGLIAESTGSQLDPEVAAAFLAHDDRFADVFDQFVMEREAHDRPTRSGARR